MTHFRSGRWSACALIACVGIIGGRLNAQDEQETVQITLHPMAAPKQALKYELLPPFIERQPGNAAVDYGKVKAEQDAFFGNSALQLEISELCSTSLEAMDSEHVARKLANPTVLDRLHRAARREHVDWQLPYREGLFYAMLLGELQETRSFARLLCANARMYIARSETDEALRNIQSSLAMSRQVSESVTLISGLIGTSTAMMTLEQVQAWIQQPGAPNLYWSLTALPEPMIDMTPGYEAERSALELSFPELRELEDDNWADKHWQKFIEESLPEVASLLEIDAATSKLTLTGRALVYYPRALDFLLERGYKRERLEHMDVPHVVMLYTMINFRECADETYKWLNVPYWQVPQSAVDEAIEKRLSAHEEIIPLAKTLLPAISYARGASVRVDRKIALLRLLEALRIHAASHESSLPNALSELEVPVPIDPVTGQPFSYRLDGNHALIEGPRDAGYAVRVQVQIARPTGTEK